MPLGSPSAGGHPILYRPVGPQAARLPSMAPDPSPPGCGCACTGEAFADPKYRMVLHVAANASPLRSHAGSRRISRASGQPPANLVPAAAGSRLLAAVPARAGAPASPRTCPGLPDARSAPSTGSATDWYTTWTNSALVASPGYLRAPACAVPPATALAAPTGVSYSFCTGVQLHRRADPACPLVAQWGGGVGHAGGLRTRSRRP